MPQPFIRPLGMAHNPVAAARLVKTTFTEGQPDQYKRELTWNSVQAGATEINATALRFPEDEFPGYGIKAAFVDNGVGMAATKISDYLGELFNGESQLAVDGNFQMGARVSTLPWNHAGLLIASWVEGDEDGTLIHIAFDPESGIYGVLPFEDEDGVAYETGIPEPWMKHPIIRKSGHGTVVVLLGNDVADHTVGEIEVATDGTITFPQRRATAANWHYYNSKYWALPDGVTLRAVWGLAGIEEWRDRIAPGDYALTATSNAYAEEHAEGFTFIHRTCQGLDQIMDKARVGKEAMRGTVPVTSAKGYCATVHWALFPEEKMTAELMGEGLHTGGATDDRDHGIPLGLFAERHGAELYNIHSRGDARTWLERYGIGARGLRDRLVIVVEPDRASERFIGAVPASARDKLLIANGPLPHAEWGESFFRKMPKEISQRLNELRGESSVALSRRQHKHILPRISAFFARPLKNHPQGDTPIDTADRSRGVPQDTTSPRTGTSDRHPRTPGTTGRRDGPGDVASSDGRAFGRPGRSRPPREINFFPVGAEFFSDCPGKIVKWQTGRQLYLNTGHPVIRELVREETAGRPDSKEDEIPPLAYEAIGEHLITLILAAESYSTSALTGGDAIGKSWVDRVVNDDTLTAACLNVETLGQLIRTKFQGRVGFGKVRAGSAA